MSQSALPKPELPGLKLFRHEGCNSYLFYDVSTRHALMIDARADLMEDYRDFIAERQLKPDAVVDTRLQWHHLSGSHLFAETYGVAIAASSGSESERCTRKLAPGEKFAVGGWEFVALATPGVCPDAICLSGAGLLFSGDTLLIGSPARTDFADSDVAALWRSLHETLAPLPGNTIVLPGHDFQELLFSTLEMERKRGPDFQAPTCAALAQAKSEEKPARRDGDVRKRIEYNLSAHPEESPESHFGGAALLSSVVGDAGGVATINVEKYALKMKKHSPGNCFLDVREPSEFQAGHMPGALNIPLSELALHWAELAAFKRIYVSCRTQRRSRLAAHTLDYLGLPDVVIVGGGFKAWQNAGYPVE